MAGKRNQGKVRAVAVLTSGGDCPGLNAVIRGLGKALVREGVEVYGVLDGFVGLIENRFVKLKRDDLSGLLTVGGTILGAGRHKPYKMPAPGGGTVDLTGKAVAGYRKLGVDCLICLGGGGTHKSARRLMQTGGVEVVTLPKTIDNDVSGTDLCFGYDTAVTIAAEALDRLHTTAAGHGRTMLVDLMGHNAGWLALAAGLAAGADVILIPEIPYRLEAVARALAERKKQGKRFSIVAVAEGAVRADGGQKKRRRKTTPEFQEPLSWDLVHELKELTDAEFRVTTLGHLQRGGVPTPTDRILCTLFGTKAAELVLARQFGVMVALRNGECVPVPLEEVAGKRKQVPLDHPLIQAARAIGVCLGD